MSTYSNNVRKSIRQLKKDDFLYLLSKNTREMLKELNRPSFGFVAFLETRSYCEVKHKVQILEMIIEVLGRVCSEYNHRFPLLQMLFRKMIGCQSFLYEDIPWMITFCFTNDNSVNLPVFMAYYMNVLANILYQDFFPCKKILCDIFPSLENYMNRLLEKRIKNSNIAAESFENLKVAVERYDQPENVSEDDDDNIAIKTFRNLSIVPRSDDLLNYEIPYIPQNIIDCPYRSVDHYLSVHYRLMREDMLRSFRECIKECLSSNKCRTSDKNNNRLYENVTVQGLPKYTRQGKQYYIIIKTAKETDWTKKDVLRPGSLVFLTPNEFNTVVFASVVNDPQSSKSKSNQCRFKIKLEDDLFQDDLNKNTIYKMIEPDAYFECYKHVLSGIKKFTESTFPLSDMLTYLDFSDPYPEYLIGKKYVIHNDECNHFENKDTCSCTSFDPLNKEDWPVIESLDSQQTEAFMTALTQKVAVIQGPPGTGKTHVGVKIVKTLLENDVPKPIVISCLTNHALDQFLEKMLKYTKKIVRIGSQSKSDVLEPHYLDNLKYAITCYHQYGSQNLDKLQKLALNVVKCLANTLLKDRITNDFDAYLVELDQLCDVINIDLRAYCDCTENYLEDNALNDIIDTKFKGQLRKVSGGIEKTLTSSVLEWLVTSHMSDLYVKCQKKFSQFDKMENFDDKMEIFESAVKNIWGLTENKRYELFYYWRKKCLEIRKKHLEENIDEYKTIMLRSRDSFQTLDNEKLELLKGADIIGLTTTGACKFKQLIYLTDPCIFVVEEAAQVLEAHIIASLVPSAQHLIMIGDHEQLHPLPADHELGEKYNLKVSMFERLFLNKAPSATLVTQHRMKPCIAELLVPKPYEMLESSKSVYLYEEIIGVKSSVFFFDHREIEDPNSSGTSSSNDFEAQMIVTLAQYFILQSYNASQITILAMYALQVKKIYDYLQEKQLEIHVTTVDNYQGEENDIMLLSFVRSNSSVIGFLKESNRVCVALSRAKMGMFCLGNFQLFADKSEMWKDIVDNLHQKSMIGDALSLTCPNHKTLKFAKSSDDILKFIDNGCSEKCGYILPCKHECHRTCHFKDSDHILYQCRQPCERMIAENRVCPRLCFERCKRVKKKQVELPCGHKGSSLDSTCYDEVTKLLPCNHFVTIPCHIDIKFHKCEAAVTIELDCGHTKLVQCHLSRSVNFICTELKPEIGICGHTITIPCNFSYLNENELIPFCDKPCGVFLDCGHTCKSLCKFCFDSGIHGLCTEKCEESLPCGHVCNGLCNSPCTPCNNKCLLSCAHNTQCINECLRPCVKCNKKCARSCIHNQCSKLCWEKCDVDPCNERCSERMPCGHQCLGLCGDPCPKMCLICSDLLETNKSGLYVELKCGHLINVEILDKHIENCLISFDWPNCPECGELIISSTRYKRQLSQLKQICLESCDTSEDIKELWYLLRSMYGKDYIIPAQFWDIHHQIEQIMKVGEKLKSNNIYVLKNCVLLLGKLVSLTPKLHTISKEIAEQKFDTLKLWISRHLIKASYQQLKELQECVEDLETIVLKYKY